MLKQIEITEESLKSIDGDIYISELWLTGDPIITDLVGDGHQPPITVQGLEGSGYANFIIQFKDTDNKNRKFLILENYDSGFLFGSVDEDGSLEAGLSFQHKLWQQCEPNTLCIDLDSRELYWATLWREDDTNLELSPLGQRVDKRELGAFLRRMNYKRPFRAFIDECSYIAFIEQQIGYKDLRNEIVIELRARRTHGDDDYYQANKIRGE